MRRNYRASEMVLRVLTDTQLNDLANVPGCVWLRPSAKTKLIEKYNRILRSGMTPLEVFSAVYVGYMEMGFDGKTADRHIKDLYYILTGGKLSYEELADQIFLSPPALRDKMKIVDTLFNSIDRLNYQEVQLKGLSG